MKRITIIILAMVLLILVGCSNNESTNYRDYSRDYSVVSNTSTEQTENSSKSDAAESVETEGSVCECSMNSSEVSQEESSEISNQSIASEVFSDISQPSELSKETNNGSTADHYSGSNSEEESNINNNEDKSNGTVVDDYVYKDPTVFVEGMYTLDNAFERYVYIPGKPIDPILRLCMGELYVERSHVTEVQSYYNYTTQKGVQFNNNSIITDVNKMPSNYKLYAYVIDTIPIWLYEENITYDNCKGSLPIEEYAEISEYFSAYAETITMFYNRIGNIDYENIDVNMIHDSLLLSVYHPYSDPIDMDELIEYVEYVKTNKIKLSIVAEPLLPIIYVKDGMHFVRTKVTIKVKSSNVDDIKLFLHGNYTLKGEETSFYVDVPLAEHSLFNHDASIYIYEGSLAEYIIG